MIRCTHKHTKKFFCWLILHTSVQKKESNMVDLNLKHGVTSYATHHSVAEQVTTKLFQIPQSEANEATESEFGLFSVYICIF